MLEFIAQLLLQLCLTKPGIQGSSYFLFTRFCLYNVINKVDQHNGLWNGETIKGPCKQNDGKSFHSWCGSKAREWTYTPDQTVKVNHFWWFLLHAFENKAFFRSLPHTRCFSMCWFAPVKRPHLEQQINFIIKFMIIYCPSLSPICLSQKTNQRVKWGC